MNTELFHRYGEDEISNFLNTQAGKMQLATIIGEALIFSESNLLRECLLTQRIPEGDFGRIRRINQMSEETIIRVNEEGQGLEILTEENHGLIPQFEIGNNPQISLSMVKQSKENLKVIFEKTIEKVKKEMDDEEEKFLSMFFETKKWDYYEKFTNELIIQAIQNLIDFRLTPSKIIMSPFIFTLITNEENLKEDKVPKKLFGLDLHLSNICDDRSIYILPIPEQLGIIHQRIPITSLPADNPEMRSIGYSIFESLGIAFFGCNHIQKLCVNDYFQMARMRNKKSFIFI